MKKYETDKTGSVLEWVWSGILVEGASCLCHSWKPNNVTFQQNMPRITFGTILISVGRLEHVADKDGTADIPLGLLNACCPQYLHLYECVFESVLTPGQGLDKSWTLELRDGRQKFIIQSKNHCFLLDHICPNSFLESAVVKLGPTCWFFKFYFIFLAKICPLS